MCAPSVMKTVRQEISRRHALGLLAAPAVVGTASRPVAAREQDVIRAEGFTTIHDLTHALTPKTPVFPGVNPIQVTPRLTIASNGIFAAGLRRTCA